MPTRFGGRVDFWKGTPYETSDGKVCPSMPPNRTGMASLGGFGKRKFITTFVEAPWWFTAPQLGNDGEGHGESGALVEQELLGGIVGFGVEYEREKRCLEISRALYQALQVSRLVNV